MATAEQHPKHTSLPKHHVLPAASDYKALKAELAQYWQNMPAEDVWPVRSFLLYEAATATGASILYSGITMRIARNSPPGWRFACTTMSSILGLLSGSLFGLWALSQNSWQTLVATGAGRIIEPYWRRYGGRRHLGKTS